MDKEILNIEGAADLLGVSPTLIYKLARKSQIPGTKIGRAWRFHKPTLIQWVANGSSVSAISSLIKKSSISKQYN